jgi:hypothetical protein
MLSHNSMPWIIGDAQGGSGLALDINWEEGVGAGVEEAAGGCLPPPWCAYHHHASGGC